MARPRVHDDTTRERLLDTAGTILRRDGATALTVRRLADDAGVSTSAIYSLFGGKEDVVRAMYREGFANLARLQAAVETDDPATRLHRHALAYREAARSRPHLFDVMFACPFPEFEPSDSDQALSMGTLEALQDAVVEGIRTGVVAGDPAVVTMALWSTVHGLATLELAGSLDVATDADEVWATTIDAVLAGLAPA
ncbi:TetR/AcrR family transcriptional regulator [Salsipaludibacter albus]|uniref:TetR/AcrR family transcriptional regulator n=1 Tax=Salsipaludibacter albus TaxID=2849650 RepID=UPI001EE46C38|nr:TetR/AcrR family transcriptional regulator [Salsipaludibacter albus]MBY5162006.1 TetR/AcrR family transcriptional regulator [Salsipaludibacter albus]